MTEQPKPPSRAAHAARLGLALAAWPLLAAGCQTARGPQAGLLAPPFPAATARLPAHTDPDEAPPAAAATALPRSPADAAGDATLTSYTAPHQDEAAGIAEPLPRSDPPAAFLPRQDAAENAASRTVGAPPQLRPERLSDPLPVTATERALALMDENRQLRTQLEKLQEIRARLEQALAATQQSLALAEHQHEELTALTDQLREENFDWASRYTQLDAQVREAQQLQADKITALTETLRQLEILFELQTAAPPAHDAEAAEENPDDGAESPAANSADQADQAIPEPPTAAFPAPHDGLQPAPEPARSTDGVHLHLGDH